LALALVGLICIGLLGLGGVVWWTRTSQIVEEAAIPPTPTPIPPTLTPTSTPSPAPTETPLPTATSTPVVPIDGGEETGLPPEGGEETDAAPTGTRVLEGATAIPTVEPPTPIATTTAGAEATAEAAEMPGSGGVLPTENGFLIWAGVGLLVVLIVGVTGRFKRN
jgi:cytoskeletal protein RodZ